MTPRTFTRRPVREDERGMALAIALLAIVCIGALIGATFVAGQLEMGSGRSAVYGAQSQEQAETSLTEALTDWDTNWNIMAIGAVANGPTVSGVGLRRSYTVTRLGGNLFQILGQGERLNPGSATLASRSLAKLARITFPNIEIEAAVTATGDVNVGGNAEITGLDQNPPGWACTNPLDSVGGVRTTGTVNVGGSATVTGDPPEIENDTTITSSTFTDPYTALAPLANFRWGAGPSSVTNINGQQPSTTGSPARCDRTDNNNWGEPYRTGGYVPECITFFPIMHVTGELRVQNGRGQGIILVTRDLEIRGNFIFDGIIIVLGEVRTTGTGNKVTGAVLANNAQIGDLTSFAGNPDVIFSSCAIAQALHNSARGVALNERSWAQIF